MSNVTIIMPIHEFGDNLKKYIDAAITSILQQVDAAPNLLIVYTARAKEGGLLDFLEEKQYGERITTVLNEGKTDYCGQVNFGANAVTTDYFSIIEVDDEYSRVYFRNVDKCIKNLPDVGLFLPITVDVDDQTNSPVQLVNQSIWSNGYVGENGVLGYLNTRSLNEYSFYTLGGAVFKKQDFLTIGGLKSNIVFAFTYEFLLRFLNNANKVFTIPKFGYKHTINRNGSYFVGLGAVLSQDDRKFWFETAKKESHFFKDRVIDTTKKPTNVEEVVAQ